MAVGGGFLGGRRAGNMAGQRNREDLLVEPPREVRVRVRATQEPPVTP